MRASLLCLIMVFSILPLFASGLAAQEWVTVHADQDLGPVPLDANGFLHGLDEDGHLDHDAVATLDPKHWRLYKFINYAFATAHNAEITYGLSDHYAWSQGGFPEARPWLDWEGYEEYIAEELALLYYYFPDHKPEFFDIWNEPDHPYFWTGTYEQLLELFARCHAVVKNFDPEAKLVGPSISKYIPGGEGVANLLEFLRDLDQIHGIRLEAVSWHENDSGIYGGGANRPEHVLAHTDFIRSGISHIFPPDYQPELHINEYTGGRVHLSPGYNVGYIYYLMEARIDAAMRACWYVYSGDEPPFDYWSTCWDGLSGMFMNDGFTPQVSYWIYRALGDMEGETRLATESSSPSTNVIASRDEVHETLSLILGRHYHYSTTDLHLSIEGYPFDHESVRIHVERVPHFPDFFDDPYSKAIPLPGGPVDPVDLTRPVSGGAFTFTLEDYADNDAYLLSIFEDAGTSAPSDAAPMASPRILGTYPNPFNPRSEIRFVLPEFARVDLAVHDIAGRRLVTLIQGELPAGEHRIVWRGEDSAGRDLSSGVYILRLADGRHADSRRLVLIR